MWVGCVAQVVGPVGLAFVKLSPAEGVLAEEGIVGGIVAEPVLPLYGPPVPVRAQLENVVVGGPEEPLEQVQIERLIIAKYEIGQERVIRLL